MKNKTGLTAAELGRLSLALSSLSVFRGVLEHDVMRAFSKFLDAASRGRDEAVPLYGEFVYLLGKNNCSFSDFLKEAVFEDENEYIIRAGRGEKTSNALAENAETDLRLLSTLTDLVPENLAPAWENAAGGIRMPLFENEHIDLSAEYAERVKNVGKLGYGIFSRHGMFRLDGEKIVPVGASDETDAGAFVGYEAERAEVFANTRALAEGRQASNILLFGDAGTGKSSTVKASANMFRKDGVRLIELRRDQILSLSSVMERITENLLKFIIFIDDLSFGKNDDSFAMLKAALEGSASARAKNAVIYATSNRRHIVMESFSDRDGDDVHHGETVQELMSLSDRFGLVVYFGRPDKKLYLKIVHALAQRAGVDGVSGLDEEAEAFALAKGSRSPRAAEQFIESVIEKQNRGAVEKNK